MLRSRPFVSGALATLGAVAVIGLVPPGIAQASTQAWVQLSPETGPPARGFSSMTFDGASGQFVLFGGRVGSAISDDDNGTWVYKKGDWTEETTPDELSAREMAAMAYDPTTKQVVLFGGRSATETYGDTWVWSNGSWSEASPKNSPSPRAAAAMVYDQSSGQLLLFGGGIGATTWYNDTWVWNRKNWKQLSPAASPSPRLGASLAYDPKTRDVVLFGGYANNGDEYNDTWTWNGQTWSNPVTAKAPSGRVAPALAYDPAIGKVVLFGGYLDDEDLLGDTWFWNGAKWHQEYPRRVLRREGTAGSISIPRPVSSFSSADGGNPRTVAKAIPGRSRSGQC